MKERQAQTQSKSNVEKEAAKSFVTFYANFSLSLFANSENFLLFVLKIAKEKEEVGKVLKKKFFSVFCFCLPFFKFQIHFSIFRLPFGDGREEK